MPPAELPDSSGFKRNCGDVLGRECSHAEKADVLTFLIGL
jgi:hypothetical protein